MTKFRVVINPRQEKLFKKFLENSKYFPQNKIIKSNTRYIKIEIDTLEDELTKKEIWKKLFNFQGKTIYTTYFQDDYRYYH